MVKAVEAGWTTVEAVRAGWTMVKVVGDIGCLQKSLSSPGSLPDLYVAPQPLFV